MFMRVLVLMRALVCACFLVCMLACAPSVRMHFVCVLCHVCMRMRLCVCACMRARAMDQGVLRG